MKFKDCIPGVKYTFGEAKESFESTEWHMKKYEGIVFTVELLNSGYILTMLKSNRKCEVEGMKKGTRTNFHSASDEYDVYNFPGLKRFNSEPLTYRKAMEIIEQNEKQKECN